MRKKQQRTMLSGITLAVLILGSILLKLDTHKPKINIASPPKLLQAGKRLTDKPKSTEEIKVNAAVTQVHDEAFYVPRYEGKLSVVLNENEPIFADLVPDFQAYYVFSDLDELGRVGSAEAVLGPETLPKEKRKSIREVIPSGWQQGFYSFIEQQALYTRSHLIAHQLCGENANPENLMTGTYMFNAEGMLPYENFVKKYIKQTGNHVQYRVTPIFGYFDYNEDNLVADGVQMEAQSVEDNGKGVKFNVFIYNVQTGVDIDYLTGENKINKQGRAMGFKIEKKKYRR